MGDLGLVAEMSSRQQLIQASLVDHVLVLVPAFYRFDSLPIFSFNRFRDRRHFGLENVNLAVPLVSLY